MVLLKPKSSDFIIFFSNMTCDQGFGARGGYVHVMLFNTYTCGGSESLAGMTPQLLCVLTISYCIVVLTFYYCCIYVECLMFNV